MNRAIVAGVSVGDGLDVAVAGVLNVSPESFYAGSVVAAADRLLAAGEAMVRAGAAWLDVGAMSTAPYLETSIPEALEAERLQWAVALLTSKLGAPVSADVSRAEPARAALAAGARVVNDVTGLVGDPALVRLVADAGAALIVMASPVSVPAPGPPGPVETVRAALARSLAIARAGGVPDERILLDPGIGFFRGGAWPDWDCRVLAGLAGLRGLGRPLHVGVSRKSFIGAVAGVADPGDRLPGTLAATAAAVAGGAHVIRAHDVAETVQAVRVAQAIRRAPESE
jgi:dihydropteroate synthase